MSWFNSWQDFTKKASEAAKTASDKAAEVAKQAADTSKVLASNVHDKVNQFVKEQKKEYNAVEHETDLQRRKLAKKDEMMHSGHCPWFIDADKNAQQLELYDELKVNILKLCEDHNNFLIKAPSSISVFDFKLAYALPSAHCALDEDPVLPEIRYKLVPRKLSEEQFWKNYFYRVNVIRESLGITKMDFSHAPLSLTPRASDINTNNTKDDKEIDEMNTEEKVVINEEVKESKKDIVENENMDEHKSREASHSTSSKEVIEAASDEVNDAQIKMDLSNSNLLPSSEQITQMNDNDINDMDEDEDFLADDFGIDALSDLEKAKMKKELGIAGSNDIDIENVDDLLAEVGADEFGDISDAELAAELENID